MKTLVFWLIAAIVLAVPNWMIVQKEKLIRSGKPVYLMLRPRDPRSLMQGDYMRLRYDINEQIRWNEYNELPASSLMVIQLDERGVARFLRFHEGEELDVGEQLLRYRRGRHIRFAPESFFFQEGTAGIYENARYAELKVSPGGDCVLIGLNDENLQPLGDRIR
ncbi:GDYXXLXY domain-containing protein [Planctomycetota bacterium]